MSKEVTKKEAAGVPAISAEMGAMFDEISYSAVEGKDLKIPKILLLQGSSVLVKDDATHKSGDIINSISHEVLGVAREKDAAPLRFIPIHMFKTWVIFEKIEDRGSKKVKLDYVETIQLTPDNSNLPWDETLESGQMLRRVKNVNFFVLLERDLGNPLAKPYVLTFRSTSLKAASPLEGHFADCQVAKAKNLRYDPIKKAFCVPMGMIFELGGKIEKNEEDQSWFVFTTKSVMPTTMEQITEVMPWYKIAVAADPSKDIDDSDVNEKEATKKLSAPEKIKTAEYKEF